MKIIQAGNLPEERTFEARCPSCKTLFEYRRDEARVSRDPRDGDTLLIVRCPLSGCYRDMYVRP